MTAAQARGSRVTVRRIAVHCDVDERTVRAALDGWRGRSAAYQRALDSADALGVDIETVPVRTAGEQTERAELRKAERGRSKTPKPCPECARQDTEIAALKRKLEDQRRSPNPPSLAVVSAAR